MCGLVVLSFFLYLEQVIQYLVCHEVCSNQIKMSDAVNNILYKYKNYQRGELSRSDPFFCRYIIELLVVSVFEISI